MTRLFNGVCAAGRIAYFALAGTALLAARTHHAACAAWVAVGLFSLWYIAARRHRLRYRHGADGAELPHVALRWSGRDLQLGVRRGDAVDRDTMTGSRSCLAVRLFCAAVVGVTTPSSRGAATVNRVFSC